MHMNGVNSAWRELHSSRPSRMVFVRPST